MSEFTFATHDTNAVASIGLDWGTDIAAPKAEQPSAGVISPEFHGGSPKPAAGSKAPHSPSACSHTSESPAEDSGGVLPPAAKPAAPPLQSKPPATASQPAAFQPSPNFVVTPHGGNDSRRTTPHHGSTDGATPSSPETGSNLFVAGLPPTVDDTVLEKAFTPFGDVLSAKVMLHVDTAASRGFGFVLFKTSSHAAAAREALHGQALEGHGGKLQVSVSRHRGENLTAESRVVYIRNVPATLVGTEILDAQLRAHGTVEKVISRTLQSTDSFARNNGSNAATGPLMNLVVHFDTPAAAKACVAATHGKKPFPECQIPLLSKVEEPQHLRESRLRYSRGGSDQAPGSATATPYGGAVSTMSPPAYGAGSLQGTPNPRGHSSGHPSPGYPVYAAPVLNGGVAKSPHGTFAVSQAPYPAAPVPAGPMGMVPGVPGAMPYAPYPGIPPAHGHAHGHHAMPAAPYGYMPPQAPPGAPAGYPVFQQPGMAPPAGGGIPFVPPPSAPKPE